MKQENAEAEAVAKRASDDQDPRYGKGQTREGGTKGRKIEQVYYVMCPVCGAGPMRPNTVVGHLRSKKCRRVHSPEEARLLAREAPRDPFAYNEAVIQLEAWIEEWEDRLERIPASDVDGRKVCQATLDIMRDQHHRLIRMGVNGYTPPPGYYDKKGG